MSRLNMSRLASAVTIALLVTAVTIVVSIENPPLPDFSTLEPVATEPFGLTSATVSGETGAIVRSSIINLVPTFLFFVGWLGVSWLLLAFYDKLWSKHE